MALDGGSALNSFAHLDISPSHFFLLVCVLQENPLVLLQELHVFELFTSFPLIPPLLLWLLRHVAFLGFFSAILRILGFGELLSGFGLDYCLSGDDFQGKVHGLVL